MRLTRMAASRLDIGQCLPNSESLLRTEDLITISLTEALEPESLTVLDESHQHEGHAGHREGGQTHFRVYIVSLAFKGKTRLERHRMINATLEGELRGGVHALAIHAAAPGEGVWPAFAGALRGSGWMRSAVMRLRSRRKTRKRKP